MRRRRGFTLIEVLVVMIVVSTASGAFLAMYLGIYDSLHSVAAQADLASDARRASAVVFRSLAADPGASIAADNHAIHFTDGHSVGWDGQRVHGLERDLGTHHVTDFSIVREAGVWTLSVEITDPARPRGGPVRCRYVADWRPTVEVHP
jgi:prepilin-type N-terminal cleavage/methylation domain-containing protein